MFSKNHVFFLDISGNRYFLRHLISLDQTPRFLLEGNYFLPKVYTAVFWSPASMKAPFHPCLASSLCPTLPPSLLSGSSWNYVCRVSLSLEPPRVWSWECGAVVTTQGLAIFWAHPPPSVMLSSQDHSPLLSPFLFPDANAHLFPPSEALLSLCFSFSLQGSPWGYVARKWLWTWKGNSVTPWEAGRAMIHCHFR